MKKPENYTFAEALELFEKHRRRFRGRHDEVAEEEKLVVCDYSRERINLVLGDLKYILRDRVENK